MRELKFKIRADGKWYDKCLITNTNNISDENWVCPLVWLDDEKGWVHCDNGVICQYTGLKDKNGKEIYEGDIIHIDIDFLNEFNYLVEWNSEYLRYYLVKANYRNNNLNDILEAHLDSLIDKVEVIGNIYDNPELIKE